MKNLLCLILCLGFVFPLFSQPESKSVTLFPVSDGFIVNNTPVSTHDFHEGSQGRELRIGWDYEGGSMRALLEFDISSLSSTDPQDSLVIESAVLRVIESNTNLHPFDGDNTTRVVKVYALAPGDISPDGFSAKHIYSCGTLTGKGYNVLEDYNLGIGNVLTLYTQNYPQYKTIRFRLQFTEDQNVRNPDESELDGSMWNIFSSEEDRWKPRLFLKYRFDKKKDVLEDD
jgi:hypothetical protein